MTKETIICTFGIIMLLSSCNSNPQTKSGTTTNTKQTSLMLTSHEVALCDSLMFDKEIANEIKSQTKGNLECTPLIDSVTGEVLKSTAGNGLSILSTDNRDYDFVLNNKEKFLAKGYLVFIFSNDWSLKEHIVIIKGHDELEILKWRKTNGINYGHDNKAILDRFRNWKKKNDFWVLAAGLDFIQIEFKKPLDNVDLFAKEVYDFCPDAIDQGAGDMPSLIREIKKMNGMYFWWD